MPIVFLADFNLDLAAQHKPYLRHGGNHLIIDPHHLKYPAQLAHALIKVVIAGDHAVVVPHLFENHLPFHGFAIVGDQ
ncbi:hypothetical protein D3C80_2052000 [compost metagenome]